MPPQSPNILLHLLRLLASLSFLVSLVSCDSVALGNLAVVFPIDKGFRSTEGHPLTGDVHDLWCQIQTDNVIQRLQWAQFVRAVDRKPLEAQIDNEARKARLVFGNSPVSVAGKYRCEMKAEGGTDIVYGNMFVYARPIVHANASHKLEVKKDEPDVVMGPAVHAIGGKNVALICPIVAYPKADIAWFKDGDEFLENERIRLNQREQKLYITGLTNEDEGVYRCEAKNSFQRHLDGPYEEFQVTYEQMLYVGNSNAEQNTRTEDEETGSLGWIYPLLVILIILLLLFIIIYACAAWKRYKADQYDVAKRERSLRATEDAKQLDDEE